MLIFEGPTCKFPHKATPRLELEGVKNLQNWGKMLIFEGPTCKFPYTNARFAYKAIWDNPRTFSPENLKIAIHI